MARHKSVDTLDKKRRRGAIRFVLLHGLGDARVREIQPGAISAILLG